MIWSYNKLSGSQKIFMKKKLKKRKLREINHTTRKDTSRRIQRSFQNRKWCHSQRDTQLKRISREKW